MSAPTPEQLAELRANVQRDVRGSLRYSVVRALLDDYERRGRVNAIALNALDVVADWLKRDLEDAESGTRLEAIRARLLAVRAALEATK